MYAARFNFIAKLLVEFIDIHPTALPEQSPNLNTPPASSATPLASSTPPLSMADLSPELQETLKDPSTAPLLEALVRELQARQQRAQFRRVK